MFGCTQSANGYSRFRDCGLLVLSTQLTCWQRRWPDRSREVHPHLLRHSWMTEMLRRGVNPIQLSVIAGASQQVIAEHYEHLTEDDAYESMIRALSASDGDR